MRYKKIIKYVLIIICIALFLVGWWAYAKIKADRKEEPANFAETFADKGEIDGYEYEISDGDYYNSECRQRGYLIEKNSDGYSYLTICSGEKSTGGYSISIKSIDINEAGEMTVIIREESPSVSDIVTEVINYPNCILSIKQLPQKIRLEDESGNKYELIN